MYSIFNSTSSDLYVAKLYWTVLEAGGNTEWGLSADEEV